MGRLGKGDLLGLAGNLGLAVCVGFFATPLGPAVAAATTAAGCLWLTATVYSQLRWGTFDTQQDAAGGGKA